MFNKKRIIVFVLFILLMFFMMTFAGSPNQNAAVALREVIFTDGFNGKDIARYEVEVGKDSKVPDDPYHKNYVFVGWFDYNDHDIRVTDFTNVLKDIHVIALYGGDKNNNGINDEEDTYFTVTFVNSITKNVIKREKVLIGMDATAPKAPTMSGYTFDGWDNSYINVTENITVNALYTKNNVSPQTKTYTVTFIDGDTNEVMSKVKVKEGASATPPTPNKHEGRLFKRWDGKYTNVRSNQTVTAIYVDDQNGNGVDDEEEKFAIRFNAGAHGKINGGSTYTTPNTYLQGVDNYPESPDSMVSPEKGYSFTGWSPTYSAGSLIPLNNPTKEFTAQYKANRYTITFDTQGGTVILPITQDYGTDITKPENPTKQGYVFGGWDKEIPSKMPAENMTITASWNAATDTPYKVEHHFKGVGENAAYVHDEEKDQTLTGETGTEVTASPLTEGIEGFEYNATESASTIKGIVAADGSLVLIVKYDRTKSTVIVNPDDPECDSNVEQCTKPTEEEKEYGDTVTLPYVSRSYTLTYEPGEGAPAVSSQTVSAEIDYYCKGTSSTCEESNRVVLNGSSKTVEVESTDTTYTAHYTSDFKVSVKAGSNYSYPTNNPTTDYTFVDWEDKADTTKKYHENDEIVLKKNMTLKGEYSEDGHEYTISYQYTNDAPEGAAAAPSNQTKKYGERGTVAAKPSVTGYTFEGWTTTDVEVREDGTFDMPAKNVVFSGTWSVNSYTVIFMNDDNSEYTHQTVNYGSHVQSVANPTKDSTAQYTYTFAGWADESGTIVDLNTYVVTGDVTLTATYSSEVNHYTIQFVNDNGSVLQSESLTYGTKPVYRGEVPTKAPNSQYTYTFAGWTPIITTVTGNQTYTATYSTTTNKYTITFVDDDGTQLQQTQVEYGVMPTAPSNPTKESTAQYTYTFAGWTPTLETVRADKTYTATYESTIRNYTITFVDDDGTQLQQTQVAYGSMPTAPSNPTKESTAQYTYTFAGWTPEIVTVTGDKTYTATYDSTVRQYNYTVHKFFDGTEEGTGTQYSANYGTTIQSSTYATSVEHYKLDNENTTTSITISEVEANNVINIYYISTRANITVTVTSDIPSNGNVEYNDIITYTIKIKNTGEETGTVTVSDADLKTAISNGFVVLTDKNGNPLNTNADALAIVGDGLVKEISANSEETITLKVRVVANVDNDITSHITGSYTDGKVTDTIDGTTVTAKVEKTIKFIEQSETLNGTNIVIVLDRSGSMSGNKFTNAKAAARSFINKVFTQTSNSNNSTISVYTFGTEDVETGNCIIGIPFTDICLVPETENVPYTRLIGTATDYTSAQSLVSTLNGNSGEMSSSIPNTSLTPYYIGFESAYKALFGTGGVATQDAYKNNANAVVFLTDGNPEYDNATLREQYVNNLHSKGVVIYTVGYNIGSNSAEANLLRSISAPDGQSFILTGTDASALTNAFDAIHADVSGKQTPTQTEKGVAEMADPSEITVDANHPILISVNETADIKDRIKPDKTHEVIVFNPDGTVKVAFNTLAEATGEDNYLVLKDGKYDLNAKKFEASDVITVRYFVTRNSRSRKAKMNVFKGMMDYKNATEALYDDFGNPIERPEIDEEIINGTVESAVEETTPEVKEEEKPITEEVKETTEEKTEETKPETTEPATTEESKEEVKEETPSTSSEEVSEQPKENEPAKEEQVEETKEEVKEESKEEVKTEEPKKEESKTEEKVEATEAKEETKVEEECKPEKKEKHEKKEEIKKELDKEVEVKVEEEKESEEE